MGKQDKFQTVSKKYDGAKAKENKEKALDAQGKELEYVCVGKTPAGSRTYAVREIGSVQESPKSE